ncbi:hypothetical protein PCA20602_02717 [Pandoraea capi]|uniref:Uncharacterized protein n=1 Tax=Pandoraea capi TaxID=2508286 RepID=A0ABY6W0U4_9BURK|nr:hypothetical protein [Pandoraea capi]VVE12680.1 hypothetical protein PCA20602_02717 [Pandoraea capi]
MTRDQSDQIEELLRDWYRWQIRQSHAETLSHFYRPTDMTCRQYVTPQWDGDDETDYQWADDRVAEQVQLCVDQLPAEQRAAISVSMRNKECGAQVWRSARAITPHETYHAAKVALLPKFVAKHLISQQELLGA